MSTPLYENLPDNINKNQRNLPENFNDLVYCIGWHEHKKWAEIEISSDFKVYPCCTLHAEHQLEKTFFDDKLDAMDDDWNNLKKHHKTPKNIKRTRKYSRNRVICLPYFWQGCRPT